MVAKIHDDQMDAIEGPCTCAHCGTVLDDDRFGKELLALPKITPGQALVLRKLIWARGSPVHMDTLIHIMFAHDIDGGPESPRHSVQHVMNRLRVRGRTVGYDIVNVRGFGYKLVKTNVVQFPTTKRERDQRKPFSAWKIPGR